MLCSLNTVNTKLLYLQRGKDSLLVAYKMTLISEYRLNSCLLSLALLITYSVNVIASCHLPLRNASVLAEETDEDKLHSYVTGVAFICKPQ